MKSLALSVALAWAAVAGAAEPPPLDLRVAKGEWGDADAADVKAVCRSAAGELWKHVPGRKVEPISVTFSTKGPMVVYGLGDGGDRRVLLNAKDSYWSQYAYQFAHEFCHVLCNYRECDKSNHWFEESLCETASLFALRRMAESWKTKPPYSNWKSYAKNLGEYADDRIKAVAPLGGLTLAEWYQRNEGDLRKNSTDRPKNQVVAVALLPLFEKHPEGWAALGSLNGWEKSRTLAWKDYLADWHARTPDDRKAFVAKVAAEFGVELK